jgi:hypothetical protein
MFVRIDGQRTVEVQAVHVDHPITTSRIGFYCKVVNADGQAADHTHVYYGCQDDIGKGPCYFYYKKSWYSCMIPIDRHIEMDIDEKINGLRHELNVLKREARQVSQSIMKVEDELERLGMNF